MKTDKSHNVLANLTVFFQHILAAIYSFSLLYFVGAPAPLWLAWAILQIAGMFGFLLTLRAWHIEKAIKEKEIVKDRFSPSNDDSPQTAVT